MASQRSFHVAGLGLLIGVAVAACSTATGTPAPTAGPTASPIVTAAAFPSRATFPPAPSPAIGDFPLGTYETTITRDDVKNAGFPSDHDMNENAGMFTLDVNADGSWRLVQTSNVPLENPVFDGTFAVSGDQIAFTTLEPTEFHGEVDMLSWKLSGSMLLLGWAGPSQGLTDVQVLSRLLWTKHPWVRQ